METRQSRMDKYLEEEEVQNEVKEEVKEIEPVTGSSRLQRNQELYKTVSSMDVDGFDLNSNTTVLDGSASNIDLDVIKEQLEEKYHSNDRNKSFGDTDEINLPKINLDETREYDINAILAKAKSEKEVNYEEERHKKVSDVLKDIEEYTRVNKVIKEEGADEETAKENDEKLKELIDTINAKELIDAEENLEVTGEMDPLDLLSDLKGEDDNTKIMGQLDAELLEQTEEKTEELTTEEMKEISSLSDSIEVETVPEEEVEEPTKEEEVVEDLEDTKTEEEPIIEETEEIVVKKKKDKKKKKDDFLDDSFIKDTASFDTEEFEDFEDLKEDMKITKVIIKILVIIVVLVFIAGLIILANSKFDWGLF